MRVASLDSTRVYLLNFNTKKLLFKEKRPGTIPRNVGMPIAQKSKETMVGMKDGNGINLCSVYPANNPYIYALLSEATQRDCWLDIQNKD